MLQDARPCGGFFGWIISVLLPFMAIDGGRSRNFLSPHVGRQIFLLSLEESSHNGNPSRAPPWTRVEVPTKILRRSN